MERPTSSFRETLEKAHHNEDKPSPLHSIIKQQIHFLGRVHSYSMYTYALTLSMEEAYFSAVGKSLSLLYPFQISF